MKVAIVGSGISGLAVAHKLQGHADITLFEASDYFGGHTHTVDVTLPTPQGEITHGVDTGFLVFNERTYPRLIALLAELDVSTAKSDMSFSVQVPGALRGRALEWSGSSLSTVFAQPSNLVNPRFLGMLADLLRFNALASRIAGANEEAALTQPLGEFLKVHRFGDAFRDWYFLPMLGCIWSCPTEQMLQFPVATMIRFCHNHGLLQVSRRPQWHTVQGGARHYVDKIVARIAHKRLNTPVRRIERDAAGVRVVLDSGAERFDRLVLATHSDQALALLHDATAQEREALGAIRYQPNRAVLHTDASVLPERRIAWAAWNYERAQDSGSESARVCLHYLINRLQPVPFGQPVVVSLNPVREIAAQHVIGEYEYDHPVFDLQAIRAQQQVALLQGEHHTWFCGAWTGYGFHEDGLKSGLAVAQELLAEIEAPWAQAA
ncbi:FAD-dependent oxidoreductase [Polaromonas sp. C04]|uniref:NAD(P)/FAD-dependent oxidoreductase n=1 Tax=Polaromonas sp. C04 TaxID=1945857 RepID=UPI0009862676|nr:FAD-dependent oxidoreductase [Polaromonas sp. C04]OOG60610.1 NAD/FAD-binding protein [Polaromonas sp. C04]